MGAVSESAPEEEVVTLERGAGVVEGGAAVEGVVAVMAGLLGLVTSVAWPKCLWKRAFCCLPEFRRYRRGEMRLEAGAGVDVVHVR